MARRDGRAAPVRLPRGRDATTESLQDAALEELMAVGQAEFAMEGVARRAFFSVGTVYNRWPDREHLIADIVQTRIAPAISSGLGASTAPEQAIEWVLGAGQEQMVLLGEALLGARTSPLLREESTRAWLILRSSLARHMRDDMSWYVATYALGLALLSAIGVHGPDPATGRVAWFTDACGLGVAADGTRQVLQPLIDPSMPSGHAPVSSDHVSLALVEAAQALLAAHGAAGTATREIARNAGVTTGALYRRYASKSGLLADVLAAQLPPDRYVWTWDLVRALAGDHPLRNAAEVLAARTIAVASDERAQAVLLQLGVAARNDDTLRALVAERIMAAHDARSSMAQQLASLDVVRPDVSPGVLTWGFQSIPVGIRATQTAGIPLDVAEMGGSIQALMCTAATPAQGHELVV